MDRKGVILEATMKVVVEHGLRGTTISQISKQAKMSAGVIYHYYASKEEIIHQLHKKLEDEYRSFVMKENPLELSIAACYKSIWISTYYFAISEPIKMEFIERYHNSAYFKDSIANARREMLEKLEEKNKISVEKGELKDLPIETIYAMTGRVAIEIAKIKQKGHDPFRGYPIETLAESVVRSILME